MLSKSHPIILFIDRFGFSVYQDTLTNIPKFNFTPDLVANLDVVNAEQFTTLVSTFIQINKIVPSGIAVILSDDVIYIKDLAVSAPKPIPVQDLKTTSNNDGEHKDEVESFLENIPFEEVLARVIKTENLNRVVAVNKDLIMTIINAFIEKGSSIDAITPGFMYGQNVNFATGLTANGVQVILGNAEILRLGNLLTDQEKMILCQDLKGVEADSSPVDAVGKKPQNRRQYVLAGIFIILLVILGVVYFISQRSDENSQVKASAASSVENIVPTVVPTIIPVMTTTSSATVVPINSKTVNIIISHDAQSSTIAASLKTDFSGMGIQNITDEVSEVSIPEKSSVVFSQNISADLRSSIVAEIKKLLPSFSILENQDSNSMVNISIGKS